MSPKLGWLQAFVSVAYHLDFRHAAADLGINATKVKQRVCKLEQWLHKVLISEDIVELSEIDGTQFVTLAWDVLQTFEAACSNRKSTPAEAALRAQMISNIRLDDLERFLAVADQRSYKGAASILECDITTINRSIKSLEQVAGVKLFSGRAALNLTVDGQAFQSAAGPIVRSLNDFRAVIPDDFDPLLLAAEEIFHHYIVQEYQLTATYKLIKRSGKKQRGKIILKDVESELDMVKDIKSKFIEMGVGSSRISAKDIDMSGENINRLPSNKENNGG